MEHITAELYLKHEIYHIHHRKQNKQSNDVLPQCRGAKNSDFAQCAKIAVFDNAEPWTW